MARKSKRKGQRAVHRSVASDATAYLMVLAQNPQEVDRLLKATPKKDQKAAKALYQEVRRRHEEQGARRQDSLQSLIYLNLFSSQLAPGAEESTFLFLRAAEVLGRAFQQGLTFSSKELNKVVQAALDSVQASMAMTEMMGHFSGPVGEANIEQAPGLRPRDRCDVSCKTCVHYLAKGHSGKGFCQIYDFWTYKKWVCDSWRGAGIYAKGD